MFPSVTHVWNGVSEIQWDWPYVRWCTPPQSPESSPLSRSARSSWCLPASCTWKCPWTRNCITMESRSASTYTYKTTRTSLWKRLKCQCANLPIFASFPPRNTSARLQKSKASKSIKPLIMMMGPRLNQSENVFGVQGINTNVPWMSIRAERHTCSLRFSAFCAQFFIRCNTSH